MFRFDRTSQIIFEWGILLDKSRLSGTVKLLHIVQRFLIENVWVWKDVICVNFAIENTKQKRVTFVQGDWVWVITGAHKPPRVD